MITEGKKRNKTSRSTMAQVSIHCSRNSEKYEGKPFKEIAGDIRKAFNGQALSDLAIKQALDAAEVKFIARKRGGQNRDRTVMVAKLLGEVVGALEKAIGAQEGTLLTDEQKTALYGLIHRKGE